MNRKILPISLLVLLSLGLCLFSFLSVIGQSPTGFQILQVTNRSGTSVIQSGNVGDEISVIATLNHQNGAYTVWFGNDLVDTGNSTGYYISSNITIPELPGGSYNITLRDDFFDANTTYPFQVESNYLIQTLPEDMEIFQEGSQIELNVSISGGEPNIDSVANITITLPEPLSTNYTKLVTLTTSSQGSAQALIQFPDSTFTPSGSTTIYAGVYSAAFNRTTNTAIDQFTVGILDASIYHRGEEVNINAVGYNSGQTATLSIRRDGSSILSESITASDQGVFNYIWTIPENAAVGNYNVTINPQNNPKLIADSQNFTIPGYPVTFITKNLADQLVTGITVEALDQATNTIYSGTTSTNGATVINLDIGNYSATAYWNEVQVGQIQITVSAEANFNITCQLTNLQITVQDKNGIIIPFINLNLTYQYTTTKTITTQTGMAEGQTDISGSYVFQSILTGISYNINANKYDVTFNSGNNTITNLPSQPLNEAIIIVPEEAITITVTDHKQNPLPNVRIELIEQTSGIFYALNTNNNGLASSEITFGRYRTKVFTSDNTLLNETIISVLSDTQSHIQCDLFNIPLSVRVVDYFGNPLSNVNIQLSRAGMNTITATTTADGTHTFENVIGGNLQLTAYLPNDQGSYVAKNVNVDEQTTIEIRMGTLVNFGGLILGTALFAVLIIVLITIIVLVIFEIFGRKKTSAKD